jgi:hypothetical protein
LYLQHLCLALRDLAEKDPSLRQQIIDLVFANESLEMLSGKDAFEEIDVWKEAKRYAESRIKHLSPYQKNQVLSALSIVVRNGLGIKSIAALDRTHFKAVMEITEALCESLNNHRKDSGV